MKKNYDSVLKYMYEKLPMFTRIGAAAYKADLNNITVLCNALQNPQNRFSCIHVAGTNGKGSTSNMIASIIQESGKKVGLYTSPHLVDFRERIRINGKMISKKFVTDFIFENKEIIERIQPSFFEITVALAFQAFAKYEAELAVIEVGMGGRLDATNIIYPLVSVITNIGMDHKDFLGDTLEKIAGEKAGIIKTNTPVVIGERQEKIDKIFDTKSSELNAPIAYSSDQFNLLNTKFEKGILKLELQNKESQFNYKISSALSGKYQLKNIQTSIHTIDVLNKNFDYNIKSKTIIKGIQNVVKNNEFYGRFQTLSFNPYLILDVAHNPDGIKELLNSLATFSFTKIHWIIGMVKDKDVAEVLSLLPKDAQYYAIQAPVPRALDVQSLVDEMQKKQLQVEGFEDVKNAYAKAKKNFKKGDLILVAGSCYIMDYFLNNKFKA